MKRPEAAGRSAADEPLDEADWAILAGIRDMFRAADPMPADLPERIRFALAVRDLEFEMARLSAEGDLLLTARGAEESRTITFDSDSMTIMIRIDMNSDGTVRVDGWLAPPRGRTIDLRTVTGSLTAVADDRGRFVFDGVPRGSTQLVVRAASGLPEPALAVVTPTLIL